MSTAASSVPPTPVATRAWWPAIGLVALVWAGLVLLLWPSAASMVAVWNSSETYTHGYVVLPIALWLIWRARHAAMATPAAPDWRALALVAALAGLWLAGRVVGAQVVEHYALVGLALATVWALLGVHLVLALLFPLFYLLLMVPSGDSLIAPMIDFTADFTIFTLRLLDFPVYREGNFFSIPSGDWSVVEACSGIRYFLSSIVLGWLYAYLTYRTWWKRVAFGVAAIVVPILANGLRAVIIVLIGHYSGMTLAVGVDHLIYGWVWFGIVMLAMFWVGARWREDEDSGATPPVPVAPRIGWRMPVAVLALVALFPAYEGMLNAREPAPSPLAAVAAPTGWRDADTPLADWKPRWLGMDDERAASHARDDARVDLHLFWYGAQDQDSELISSQNILAHEKDEIWRVTRDRAIVVDLGGERLPLRQAELVDKRSSQRLLVWYWNRIGGRDYNNPFRAKLDLARDKLLGQGDAGAAVIVAAPWLDKPDEAETVLRAYVEALRPDLNRLLDGAGQ